MPNLFFSASNETYGQITEIFDFLWPTAAGMWNLRWQVQGYTNAVPNASMQDLSNRFLHGSSIQGANLKRACVDHSWEQQQEQFSKFLLVNIFSVYESWLKILLEDIGFPQYEKSLQFPVSSSGNNGVVHAVNSINLVRSPLTQNTFHPYLVNNRKYSWSTINNLMRCYRYFKESRNCLMHNGGIAEEKLERAYQEFAVVANTTDLGVKEVPLHSPITKGAPVKIYLRGVVGLCDVILRIITTLDAELSQTASAEKEILRRWRTKYGTSRRPIKTVRIDRRQAQIVQLIAYLGWQKISYSKDLERFLIDHDLVVSQPNQ